MIKENLRRERGKKKKILKLSKHQSSSYTNRSKERNRASKCHMLFDGEKRCEEGQRREKEGGKAKERGREEKTRQEGKIINYRRLHVRRGRERESGKAGWTKRIEKVGKRWKERKRKWWREAKAKASQMLASARGWNVFKTKEGLI